MSSTTVCRGNALSVTYISAPLAPAAVASTSANQTYTISGLTTDQMVYVIGVVGTQTAGIAYAEAEVTAPNTLQIQFINTSGASATPIAGNYILAVIRPEGQLPTGL